MEENQVDQQPLSSFKGSLPQYHQDDSSDCRNNVQISGRPENFENLAAISQERTSDTERIQNQSGSRSNLFHDWQTVTGSACRPSVESQSRRNHDSLFSSRDFRTALFEQDHLEGDHFPVYQSDRQCSPNHPYSHPYHFRPRYMSSPRRGQYQDIPSPAAPQINHGDWGDSTPKKGDCSAKDNNERTIKPDSKKQEKEKKSITTKTFAHGMMDVSLLTSNSTQLRAVLSNPNHEFYTLLLWLIGLSIVLQLFSAVFLIMSDYFKTQVKEKDLQNQRKRKLLSFLSLSLVTIVTSLNVLISAFATPSYSQTVYQQRQQTDIPVFSSADIQWGHNHTEL